MTRALFPGKTDIVFVVKSGPTLEPAELDLHCVSGAVSPRVRCPKRDASHLNKSASDRINEAPDLNL
jgi:hypothetical protein